MKRHFASLFLFFILTLSLTSCGGVASASLHSEITAEINGEIKSIPVTLYEGEDYSIYIPDEEWELSSQSDAGEFWYNTENKQVLLNIVMNPGQTMEDTYEDISFSCEGFVFGEMDANNHFSGEDSFTEQMADVLLLETRKGTLIVWAEYPFSATEGVDSYLNAIVNTIQVTD